MTGPRRLRLRVNGQAYERFVDARLNLADFLRDELGLRGTHVGCEQGLCGACTVLLDGRSVRACLLLAVQAEGADVETVEGLAPAEGPLHPLQAAFREHLGLQCGFCTPGLLMTAVELLRDEPDASEAQIREVIAGNLCRCTGYHGIVKAIAAAARRNGDAAGPGPAPARPRGGGRDG